jgi:hypothetical protein
MSNEPEYHKILAATLRARLVDTGVARTTPSHRVHRCDRRSAGAAAAEWTAAAWRPPGRTVACGPLQPRRSSGRHRPRRRMNATRAVTSAVWPHSGGLSRHAIFLSGVATPAGSQGTPFSSAVWPHTGGLSRHAVFHAPVVKKLVVRILCARRVIDLLRAPTCRRCIGAQPLGAAASGQSEAKANGFRTAVRCSRVL